MTIAEPRPMKVTDAHAEPRAGEDKDKTALPELIV